MKTLKCYGRKKIAQIEKSFVREFFDENETANHVWSSSSESEFSQSQDFCTENKENIENYVLLSSVSFQTPCRQNIIKENLTQKRKSVKKPKNVKTGIVAYTSRLAKKPKQGPKTKQIKSIISKFDKCSQPCWSEIQKHTLTVEKLCTKKIISYGHKHNNPSVKSSRVKATTLFDLSPAFSSLNIIPQSSSKKVYKTNNIFSRKNNRKRARQSSSTVSSVNNISNLYYDALDSSQDLFNANSKLNCSNNTKHNSYSIHNEQKTRDFSSRYEINNSSKQGELFKETTKFYNVSKVLQESSFNHKENSNSMKAALKKKQKEENNDPSSLINSLNRINNLKSPRVISTSHDSSTSPANSFMINRSLSRKHVFKGLHNSRHFSQKGNSNSWSTALKIKEKESNDLSSVSNLNRIDSLKSPTIIITGGGSLDLSSENSLMINRSLSKKCSTKIKNYVKGIQNNKLIDVDVSVIEINKLHKQFLQNSKLDEDNYPSADLPNGSFDLFPEYDNFHTGNTLNNHSLKESINNAEDSVIFVFTPENKSSKISKSPTSVNPVQKNPDFASTSDNSLPYQQSESRNKSNLITSTPNISNKFQNVCLRDTRLNKFVTITPILNNRNAGLDLQNAHLRSVFSINQEIIEDALDDLEIFQGVDYKKSNRFCLSKTSKRNSQKFMLPVLYKSRKSDLACSLENLNISKQHISGYSKLHTSGFSRSCILSKSSHAASPLTKSKCDDEVTRIKLLQICNQDSVVPFADIYDWSNLKVCKIGEGTYGEVFTIVKGKTSYVLKVIPVSKSTDDKDTYQELKNILSEVTIAKCLSELQNNRINQTKNFNKLNRASLVVGSYPEECIKAWDSFSKIKSTYNSRPDVFGDKQLFVILELEYGGKDLSCFMLRNAVEAESILKQIAVSLAIAEEEFMFEHRDLHLGNILVQRNRTKTIHYKLRGKDISFETKGVIVSIIDFTLSRLNDDGYIYYNDLAEEVSLFNQSGDYQFQVYRDMKQKLGNEWHECSFFSNVLWLKYLCIKMEEYEYSRPSTVAHKKGLLAIGNFKNSLSLCNSAMDCLTRCGIITEHFERNSFQDKCTKNSILVSRNSFQKSKLSICM